MAWHYPDPVPLSSALTKTGITQILSPGRNSSQGATEEHDIIDWSKVVLPPDIRHDLEAVGYDLKRMPNEGKFLRLGILRGLKCRSNHMSLKSVEAQEAEREKQRDAILLSAGIPTLFLSASLETYQRRSQAQSLALDGVSGYCWTRKALEGLGFVLAGNSGGGKTHLLCSTLRFYAQHGSSIRYLSQYQFLLGWKECFGKSGAEAKYLRSLADVSLLALDDLRPPGTGPQEEMFWGLLDARWGAGKATIAATQMGLEKFQAVFPVEIQRRFEAEIFVVDCPRI